VDTIVTCTAVFDVREGTAFFLPHGWREVEYRSTWEEAKRLRRTMRLAWLWRLIRSFLPPDRMGGTVVMCRALQCVEVVLQ